MADEHESGIHDAYDRATGKPEWQSVVFSGDRRFIQSSELNELQTINRNRGRRVGNLVARDGNRVEGAAAIPLVDSEQLILTAGKLYVLGDVFPVAQRVISDVPMTGRVEIGVRITREWITHEDDPTLLGNVPGSLAEGEPGAAREVVSIAWALASDLGAGQFVPVYLMVDGTIIDQTPPPLLDGVKQIVAIYDDDAHGSYIARGCSVVALGKSGGNQRFSISEGVANIRGNKVTRYAALFHTEPEDWDTEEVAGETHTFTGTSPNTFTLAHPPMDGAPNSVLVTKEVIETVTRGTVAGTADALAHNSVTAVLEVKQGATVYAVTTSWLRTGDTIDWSPGGAEPATGSSYTVKYQYLALVSPDAYTDTTVTVSGGVDGTVVIIGYDWKLPRIDLLCLDQGGESVYVKGTSARQNALPPLPPSNMLALAEVHNDWMSVPDIVADGLVAGVRSVSYALLTRYLYRVEAHERLLELERIKNSIDAREPTAKKGMFVDPFINDYYRDEGEAQTAAVDSGILQLPIATTFFVSSLSEPVCLDYTEEVIVQQVHSTGCMKINPYQNFEPLAAGMKITPAADYWTEQNTVYASPRTQEFNRGVRQNNGPLVVQSEAVENLGTTSVAAKFIRVRAVTFRIEGMGPGEVLAKLEFDGRDVKPAGTITADGSGVIENSFTIPAGVTTGSKLVYAEGAGGSKAHAIYVGEGIIQTTTLRRVTTIERWTRPPQTQTPKMVDPLAQTFFLTEPRMLIGVDIKLCAIGDTSNNLLINQVRVENGIPTTELEAQAFVPMAGAAVGWKSARYPLPVLNQADRESAFVVMTDDANHSLAYASVDGFDAGTQSWLGSQPYAVGVMLSSSNARTWTPHQNEDLTFRLVAAKFGPLSKTVPLGTFNLVHISDLQVRAVVELPSSDCSVVFEIERATGEVWRLEPYQVLQLSEFVTETVTLRAVLTGTEKLSPILYAPVILVAGEIATSATYVTRAFALGTAVTLTPYIKAKLPAGSSLAMAYDKADDTWINFSAPTVEALSDPEWVERRYSASPITATQGRIKITLTGGPAARPGAGDFGAAIM